MARKPNIKTDKVLLVFGAVIPGQQYDPSKLRASQQLSNSDPSIPTVLVEDVPRSHDPIRTTVWAKKYPSRPACFENQQEIAVGTVDALVEMFRGRLTRAVEALFYYDYPDATEDPSGLGVWERNERFQARAAKLEADGELLLRGGVLGADFCTPEPPLQCECGRDLESAQLEAYDRRTQRRFEVDEHLKQVEED